MQAGLLCIMPVWFTTPSKLGTFYFTIFDFDILHYKLFSVTGGLGFSPSECGLCISAIALVLLHVTIFFRQRFIFILRASPLRSLRIGVGVVIFASLFLHIINKYLYSRSQNTEHPPHVSLMSLAVTIILSAILLCFAKFSRMSSNVVMQVALEPSFTSVSTIITAVTNLADILGPVLFAAVFSNRVRLKQKYPMDTSFFLTLTACTSFLVYLGTMLLNMNFKGDFGIITDLTLRRPRSRHSSSTPTDSLLDMMYIPVDDMTLLMVPSVSGYSSRLSHLNMKEG